MNHNINLYNDIILHTDAIDFRLMADRNIKNEIGFSNVLHSHTYYEMFYVAQGQMEVVLQDRVIPVSKNSFLVLPPDLLHYTRSQDPALERFSISFWITAGNASDDGLQFLQLFHGLLPRVMDDHGLVLDAFCRMEQYYISESPDKLPLMAACFYEILYLYKTFSSSAPAEQSVSSSDMANSYREYVIDNYINHHFSEEISLSELAETVFLSTSQVNRIMQNNYGQSFRKRIIFLRMENAARLLRDSRQSVKEISASVGYRSNHGFYAAFKKAYGMSPEAYRRQQKRDEDL